MLQRISILLVFILLTINTLAQDLGNSPYSLIGVGDLVNPAFAHQQGAGGGGVSFVMPFLINNANSALLSRLSKSKNTIYDAGVIGQLKELKQNGNSQRIFGGNLAYINIAFPVSNRAGASLGISPYSSVSYEYSFSEPIAGSDFLATKNYTGTGGITSLFFALGYDFTKNLRPDTLKHRFALGLKTNYLFGAIVNDVTVKIKSNSTDDYETARYRRTGFSNFVFEPGLAYTYRLNKEYKLNLGVNYSIGKDLNVKGYEALFVRQSGLAVDTTESTDGRTLVKLPSKLTLGMSIEKEFKWAIMADVSMQDWSQYRSVENIIPEYQIGKSYTASLGGQFIPNFTSVQRGFWRRTIFRAGAQYTQTPLSKTNTKINDVSFHLGATIPLARQGTFTLINFALSAGKRGTTNNGLIQENYLRIHFGATINDRWFIKPKFN